MPRRFEIQLSGRSTIKKRHWKPSKGICLCARYIFIFIFVCQPFFPSFFCHMQRKSQHFVICLLIGRLRHSLSHCVCSLPLAAKLPEILHSLILCRIKVNASSHLCVFVLCLQDLCQNIGSSLSALGNVAYVQQYQSAAAALLCQLIADFKPLSLTTWANEQPELAQVCAALSKQLGQ